MPEVKQRPLRVFLSYASQDRPAVRELSQRLAAEGWIDPWLDEKKLLPGQDWRLEIEEAVEDSDIVIICLSNHSVTKEGYVQKELRYAREIALEKPEDAIFLIPLRLDECEIPRGLRFYQWVDYFGEKKDNSYSALYESLKLRYEQKLKLEEAERIRKEKLETERIAREEAAREKTKKDAEEKARLEAKEQARQKAEKEKAERETAEMVAREKEEREAAEKLAREKAARDKAEKEAVARKKGEVAEKSKSQAVKYKPVRKTSQAEPKLPETQTAQRNSGSQLAFWIIGLVALISTFGLTSLFTQSGKPPLQLTEPSIEALPERTPSLTSTYTVQLHPTLTKTVTPTVTPTVTHVPLPVPQQVDQYWSFSDFANDISLDAPFDLKDGAAWLVGDTLDIYLTVADVPEQIEVPYELAPKVGLYFSWEINIDNDNDDVYDYLVAISSKSINEQEWNAITSDLDSWADIHFWYYTDTHSTRSSYKDDEPSVIAEMDSTTNLIHFQVVNVDGVINTDARLFAKTYNAGSNDLTIFLKSKLPTINDQKITSDFWNVQVNQLDSSSLSVNFSYRMGDDIPSEDVMIVAYPVGCDYVSFSPVAPVSPVGEFNGDYGAIIRMRQSGSCNADKLAISFTSQKYSAIDYYSKEIDISPITLSLE